MRIDRPSGRPEDRREGENPSVPEQPAQETQPRTWERRDDNGRNAAEYKRVDSGESAREAAAEERRRRDPSMRDSNGMTAAELRFLRNKRIDEAEARVSEADGPVIDPASRRSVVTDAQGRTGAEIRFQQAKRAEEATKARTPEAAAANTEPEPVSEGDGKKSEDRPEAIRAAHDQPKEYAEQRAAELQALLPEARRGRITMGVGVGTDMGGGTRV